MCVFYKWYITEFRASLVAQLVKNPPEMQETWVQFLGWEDPLEKGTATHSSILAWRSPWIVWSMGSQRVRHNWVTFAYTFNFYNHCLLIDEFSSFTLMKWRNRFNYFHLISCHWLSLPFYPFLGFCCSVTKLCPTLCDPIDCGRTGSSVLYYPLEFAQIHVIWVSEAMSRLFTSGSQSIRASALVESFQWTFRLILLTLLFSFLSFTKSIMLSMTFFSPLCWLYILFLFFAGYFTLQKVWTLLSFSCPEIDKDFFRKWSIFLQQIVEHSRKWMSQHTDIDNE